MQNGFPLPTPALKSDNKYHMAVATDAIQNVVFLGKATGDAFTMGSVLFEVYQTIKKIFGKNEKICIN